MPIAQRCLGYRGQRCGVLLEHGSRCTTHERMVNRTDMANARQRRPDLYLSKAERRRRAEAVAQWRTRWGDWCPGWMRPGHHTADLTADHPDDVHSGGDPQGALVVLCRSCNGAKQNHTHPPALKSS